MTHNDFIIIYPNEKGWQKIYALVGEDLADRRTTADYGYRDQMWRIIHDLHSMFFHGQGYFACTDIDIDL